VEDFKSNLGRPWKYNRWIVRGIGIEKASPTILAVQEERKPLNTSDLFRDKKKSSGFAMGRSTAGTDKLAHNLPESDAWLSQKRSIVTDSQPKSINMQCDFTIASIWVIVLSKTYWRNGVLRWATQQFDCGAINLDRRTLNDWEENIKAMAARSLLMRCS
jgi:hypothetical protein